MTRNLKALGLAAAAMFCTAAALASTASAQQGVLTSDGPVTLIGKQTGSLMANTFTTAAGEITCKESIYTGHKYNATPHKLIESGGSTVTVTPHFVNCVAHIFFTLITIPGKAATNGCDYLFHIGETTGESGTYSTTFDTVCGEESSIQISIYEDESEETEICHITLGTIEESSGPHLTDEGSGFTLAGQFTEIPHAYEGSACGSGESEEGGYDVDVGFTGLAADTSLTAVGISH